MRLLDNDELSPEQVNDVKDFLEDYVERNQVCEALKFLTFSLQHSYGIWYKNADVAFSIMVLPFVSCTFSHIYDYI